MLFGYLLAIAAGTLAVIRHRGRWPLGWGVLAGSVIWTGVWMVADVEGLPSAFASARDSVDVLLRDRGLRRIGPDATALALARGAEASARIEAFDGAAGPDVASAALRLSADGPEVAGTEPVFATPVEAWEAAFELYRSHVIF